MAEHTSRMAMPAHCQSDSLDEIVDLREAVAIDKVLLEFFWALYSDVVRGTPDYW